MFELSRFSLEGKVAVVTGGSRGIGKAIAVGFAKAGAKVAVTSRKIDDLKATAEEIRSFGGQAVPVQAHLGKMEEIKKMVDSVMQHFGRIDILVNNVGIVEVGGPVEYPLEKWQRALDVNVTSMFLMCKYVIPHMQKQGGSIINIGSIAGIRYSGVPYISYYTTKAATLGFSRGVALQYAKDNIRSNVIMPGLMKTPFVVEPLKDIYGGGNVDAMMDKRDGQCPMGHMGDAWDVANAALYLASDESRYTTAAELVIDGGITAKFA